MLKKHIILLLIGVCFSSLSLFSQENKAKLHRISGFIVDAESGETIIGATFVPDNRRNAVVVDNNGYFSTFISLPTKVVISSMGYMPDTLFINKIESEPLRIKLKPSIFTLNEVTITPSLKSPLNTTNLSINFIERLPSITGKPDILKALALMPGVSAQSEVSGALLVRGGSPGDNQYLLDNIPLTYIHHLGGFFSIFNPDMINSVELYKGGFPPNLGGKLSAYTNITQKRGNRSGIKGNLSVGISDLSFAVEGPIGDKSSFIVTGRKTLIELLMFAMAPLTGNEYLMTYGFHDINAKYSWMPNKKNTIDFNVYYGDDYLNYTFNEKVLIDPFTINPTDDDYMKVKDRKGNTWGNILVSGTWKREYTSKFFSSTSLSYSRYRINDKNERTRTTVDTSETLIYNQQSALQDFSLISDWQYSIFPIWDIDFGIKAAWVQHIPQKVLSQQGFNNETLEQTVQNAANVALYFNNKLPLLSWLDLHLGLRVGNYLIDKKNHFSLEPRILLNFMLNENNTLGLNYTRVAQNTQMIFVNGAMMSNQIWISSDNYIPTAFSNQFNIAWKGFFMDNMIEAEAALYYKQMNDLSDLKDGYSSIYGDPKWEDKIAIGGTGKAFGAEFSLKKTHGIWTGFLSYTYSRSFRQFDEINNGKEYIYEYDRPHALNIGLNWQINKKWSLSAIWVYQTGTPYTPVIDRSLVPNSDPTGNPMYEILVYGERNSARMRDYHRLDIGAQYDYITKKGRRACWSFSIYNVYSRQNSGHYYYNETQALSNTGIIFNPKYDVGFKQLNLYQISYFPIMPMVSYKIWFDDAYEKERRAKRKAQKLE